MTISSTALDEPLNFPAAPSADSDSGRGVLAPAPAHVTMICNAQILQRSLEPCDRLDAPISARRFDYPDTLKHHGDDMGDDFKELLTDRFGEYPDLPRADTLTPVMVKILSRRTHRAYTEEPVSEELIALLLAVALSASSKSDFQQVSIIRLKDQRKRRKIAAHFPLMPWIGTSPVFLVFCADARRLERICTIRNHPRRNGDIEAFLNVSVDAALAMQTFILAAESAGLGCCPISVIRNQMETVADELVLPDGVFPVAGLCVGYPAGKGHVSMRLPPSITIHNDTYDDAALEAQIDAYDRRRAARHAVKRDQQRNQKLFGYADFYGWSEDKARQAAEPEGASFVRYIRSHGFSFES